MNAQNDKNCNSHGDPTWPDPAPLVEELPPVPPFDIDLLPESLGPWIEDIAERMQCPPDFPAVGAMIALAGVVGRKVAIRPKGMDDWTVVANLWGALIGRPGVLKTPAMQEALRPLRMLEDEARKEHEDQVRRAKERRLIAEERLRLSRKAVRKAIEENRDAEAVAHAVLDREEGGPIRRRYLTNDATEERLGELLRENPNGITIFRDEILGLLRGLDNDRRDGARAFYLEAWNGTGSFSYDRIGRGLVEIPAAIVSILGGIQPGPVRAYLWAATRNAADDGLIQRFQLVVWPDIAREWRNVDRPRNVAAWRAAELVYRQLDGVSAEYLGASKDPDDPTAIPFLRFDPDAQARFDDWRAGLEDLLRGDEHPPAFESHLAKYRSLIPSLALLIHLASGRAASVDLPPLEKAIGWGRYLLDHARRLYACVEAPDLAVARALAGRITKGQLGQLIEKRDIYRRGWAGLTDATAVQKGLDVLCEHDWLRRRVEPTAGAPRTRYAVNPKVGHGPGAT